jgi:hypothetical protein
MRSDQKTALFCYLPSRLLKCPWLGILSTRMGYRWSIAYFLPFGASHDSGSGKEATLHSSLICTVFI